MKLTKAMAEKIFSAKDYEEAKRNAAEVGYELSEKEDAELKKSFSKELSDDELSAVAGGKDSYDLLIREYDSVLVYEQYDWVGGDEDLKYLCPNCGRPVHKGTLGRFYCDPCDESWFLESNLKMNPVSWVYVKTYSYMLH